MSDGGVLPSSPEVRKPPPSGSGGSDASNLSTSARIRRKPGELQSVKQPAWMMLGSTLFRWKNPERDAGLEESLGSRRWGHVEFVAAVTSGATAVVFTSAGVLAAICVDVLGSQLPPFSPSSA